ncbi:TonB-dependent receptor [Aequoribacter fuscus]|uniref:TonB-dependent receptor n=1 Tax=Aequoribacter fuscus TaxID=2518989 RepID=F3L3E5_9GAMM|nr:TonB-dependent receptor [Aequoribacter fuscus]EGG29137.1 TonB-dependent receptor [Aequoribacter fuscus]
MNLFKLTPMSLAVAAVVSLPFVSYAQDEEQAKDGIEEVLVTGSRIKRPDNADSSMPMVSLGEEQIELTGSINVYDILNEIPQAGAAGSTRGNSNFTVGSSGINTVNLRGLGDSRTLTLVNGRRWVPGIPGTSIVDLNSIPADLIERLEIITGGASSVYGSDAVAGVVNVILRDDYEGVTVEAMSGAYNKGDGDTSSFSITAGSNFSDGKGNAIVNLRVDEQGSVFARDRKPYTGNDVFYYGYYYGADYGAPYDSLVEDPAYSSYIPQGRFFPSGNIADGTGLLTFDCSERNEYRVLSSDTVVDYSAAGGGAACGFNRTYFRQLEVPIDRKSLYSKLTYDFSDNHKGFTEISFTSVQSVSALEPFPMSSEDVYGGLGTFGYHYENPYVPQEIADAAVAANAGNPDWNGHIPFIRRLEEVGARGASNTRETLRVAFGSQGALFGLDYDWYYQYGKASRDQLSGGQFNALAFRDALDAEVDSSGNIVCADPVARAAGCVPINLFGIGSITPEMADWVRYRPSTTSELEQRVFAMNFTGSFDLLDREISYAFGFERRDERSEDVPDDLQQKGLHGGNRIPATYGSFDVDGVYLEALIPLLSEIPLVEALNLEMAYRQDDYSTTGTVDATKLGLNWMINDQFRFRAVWAESVRAPSIDDLFAGQAQTYTSISDPCSGVGTATEVNMDPTVVANCLSIPDVAATAAAGTYNPDSGQIEPGFFYTQPDIQGISGFVGGNPDLEEETADTETFGLVWTPSYIDGLVVSLDYYKIEIENVISSISATRLINTCFESLNFSTEAACNGHERFPGTGKLRYWYSYGINQSAYETEGYDLSARYRFDSLGIVPGQLDISAIYTRLDTNKYDASPGANDEFDYAGEVGYNEDKLKLSLVWSYDEWLLSVDTTYYGEALDDVGQSASDYSLNAIDAITYVDLQARYSVDDKWSVYLGVDNVTNEQPPFCPTCKNETTPGSNYTGSQYRVWDSRYTYGGVKYRF